MAARAAARAADREARAEREPLPALPGPAGPAADPTAQGAPDHDYERAIRVVAWGFLMATVGIVAASGLWRDILPTVVVLVAVAGGAVLVFGELLPVVLPRPAARRWGWRLGTAAAIAFAVVLVAVTGGAHSPFFVAFPLIAIGTALAGGWRQTIFVTLGAAGGYGLALGVGGPISDLDRVGAIVNLLVLALLAFIGAVVRSETRRVRETALRLSSIDALTGLYNRSYLFAALEREIARSDRSGRGFCLVMLDVDDLKAVNDEAGHHVGDGLIRAVADTVRRGIRRIDVAARYAGDEFVALLPETEPSGGWIWAEKIRLGVSEQHIPGSEVTPTVSIGVVAYPQDGRTADALMISADRAMYASKRGGKNRVAWASGEPRVAVREPAREAAVREAAVREPAPRYVAAPEAARDPLRDSIRDSIREPITEVVVPRWPEVDRPGRPVGPGNRPQPNGTARPNGTVHPNGTSPAGGAQPANGTAPEAPRPAEAFDHTDDWRWGPRG